MSFLFRIGKLLRAIKAGWRIVGQAVIGGLIMLPTLHGEQCFSVLVAGSVALTMGWLWITTWAKDEQSKTKRAVSAIRTKATCASPWRWPGAWVGRPQHRTWTFGGACSPTWCRTGATPPRLPLGCIPLNLFHFHSPRSWRETKSRELWYGYLGWWGACRVEERGDGELVDDGAGGRSELG